MAFNYSGMQEISEEECIGNSLAKINNNFETLDTSLNQLSTVYLSANSLLNVGSEGIGVYKEGTSNPLQLRKIAPGTPNVVIEENSDVIQVSVYGVSAINTGEGDGNLIKTSVNYPLTIKSIAAGNNITITDNTDNVLIDAEVPLPQSGANVGAGSGEVYLSNDENNNLLFKTLKAGDNVTITNNPEEIIINSTSTVLSTQVYIISADDIIPATGINLGGGEGNVYVSSDSNQLLFKTIRAGANIIISNTEDEIIIDSTVPVLTSLDDDQPVNFGEVNTASNVGSDGAGIFKEKNGVDLQFKRIVPGSNINILEEEDVLIIEGPEPATTTIILTSDSGTVKVLDEGVVLTTNATSLNFTGNGVLVSNSGQEVTITIPGSEAQVVTQQGEATGLRPPSVNAQNVGVASTPPIGVFKNKSGETLRFKSIASTGVNITVSEANDVIQIDSRNTISSVQDIAGATGEATILPKSGDPFKYDGQPCGGCDSEMPELISNGILNLKRIKAGPGIQLTDAPKDVIISVHPSLTALLPTEQEKQSRLVVDLPEQHKGRRWGGNCSFFLMGDGSIRFCGSNKSYQGGVGNVWKDKITTPKVPCFYPPLLINETVEKVVRHGACSYALTDRGALYVCGKNNQFQLGIALTNDQKQSPALKDNNIRIFTRVAKTLGADLREDTADMPSAFELQPSNDTIIDVEPGSGYSSDDLTVFALTKLGQVLVWGYNGTTNQRAGIGNTTAKYIETPQYINAGSNNGLPAYTDDPVVQLVNTGSRGFASCFARTRSGKVYSLGEGNGGILGNGKTGTATAADNKKFTEVTFADPNVTSYKAFDLTAVGDGNARTAWIITDEGVDSEGRQQTKVYGTGYNNIGQAAGTTQGGSPNKFTNISQLNNKGITKIVAHADGTFCTAWALGGKVDEWDSAYVWGHNNGGQFGSGATNSATAPTAYDDEWPFLNKDINSLTDAYTVTIKQLIMAGTTSNKTTLILDSLGRLWAAGYNLTYMCGRGYYNKSAQTTFQRVLFNPSLGTPVKLGANDNAANQSCFFAVLNTGKLLAWGWDGAASGQLGVDATPAVTAVPSVVVLV